MKKITCFVLVLAMLFSLNLSPVLAAGDAEPVKHTITFEVPAAESESGITPYIWGQINPGVNPGVFLTTTPFNVPERYMAFEMTATNTSGQTVNGDYQVDLIIYDDVHIASAKQKVDGATYKVDWIDLNGSNIECKFGLHNYTSQVLKIKITYYSWA